MNLEYIMQHEDEFCCDIICDGLNTFNNKFYFHMDKIFVGGLVIRCNNYVVIYDYDDIFIISIEDVEISFYRSKYQPVTLFCYDSTKPTGIEPIDLNYAMDSIISEHVLFSERINPYLFDMTLNI